MNTFNMQPQLQDNIRTNGHFGEKWIDGWMAGWMDGREETTEKNNNTEQ